MLNSMMTGAGDIYIHVDNEIMPPVNTRHPKYHEIVQAVAAKDGEAVKRLVSIANALTEYTSSDVVVKNHQVWYRGKAIYGYLQQRIVEQLQLGYGYEPMCEFLANLYDNPMPGSIEQLYPFIEKHGLVLTDDGCFLAFKWVSEDSNGDLWACHANPDGTRHRNNPGDIISMPRDEVTYDPSEACGAGLHCGAQGYGGGGTCVLTKVNPRDAVSIPADHNHMKLRCCKYTVLHRVDANTVNLREPVYANTGLSVSRYAPEKVKSTFSNQSAGHWDSLPEVI